MKARAEIIALIISVGFCIPAWADADEGPTTWSFAKYYEPYEPNIEPNAPGYKLPLDINDIVNYNSISSQLNLTTSAQYLIQQNGFAIVEPDPNSLLGGLFSGGVDLINIYKTSELLGATNFLTIDTGFYLYHTQFDETLKEIEECLLIPDINELTIALLDDALKQYEQLQGDLKEAARRNISYLSVAQRLIDPNSSIPDLVVDVVSRELSKIGSHQGFASSDIFIYEEDYSQYVPRGHYTRSEALKRYFKTMMWYGRMAFLLKGSENWGPTGQALISVRDARIQTLQAFLLAISLKNVQLGQRTGLGIWDRLYKVTAFYVGLADDLTPYDYLWALDQVFDNDFELSDLADENNLLALKTELALLPSPKIYGGTGNIMLTMPITNESLNDVLDKTKGMRLMGQRYVPDSYIFQHLVFPEVDVYVGDPNIRPFTIGSFDERAYIRGLDLMALLGSNEALNILTDDGDTSYHNYEKKFDELKGQFDALNLTDWNVNLYWSWLYSLKGVLKELPEGYPEFMRTAAWQRHQLNATLSSWTQLRHDTILHAKSIYLPPPAAIRPPPPCYIEPIPICWGRLWSLTRMTLRGLEDLNVLTSEASQRLNSLEELLQQILEIVAKQLTNEELSYDDREFFKQLPSKLESMVRVVKGQSLGTCLVADVFTNPLEAKVVQEAVGDVDLIVVACPMSEDKAFLAVGPVLSYYEFKHPMSDRLTDEAWQQMIDSPQKPDRPKWYVPLIKQTDKSTRLTRLTNNSSPDGFPCWSHDGRKIAFVSERDRNAEIYVMNADGSEQKRLTNSLYYDLDPCWSPDGKKIAFRSGEYGKGEIYIMNADGSEQINLTNNSANDSSPSWSPDGEKIAFQSGPLGKGEIYVMNDDGNEPKRLTYNLADDSFPCWSPNGEKIAFTSRRDRYYEIYIMNTDGSEQKRLTYNDAYDVRPCWSPDGEKIAFITNRDGNHGKSEIYIMNSDGSEQKRLTNNDAKEMSPSWSPDGKKIAYESYMHGFPEIYVMDISE